ncbi:MAG: hypothetical protein OXR73_17570, partial [Myxococcales bacterium]|nr:hypothetical protein [Myxococcales bacterium]
MAAALGACQGKQQYAPEGQDAVLAALLFDGELPAGLTSEPDRRADPPPPRFCDGFPGFPFPDGPFLEDVPLGISVPPISAMAQQMVPRRVAGPIPT